MLNNFLNDWCGTTTLFLIYEFSINNAVIDKTVFLSIVIFTFIGLLTVRFFKYLFCGKQPVKQKEKT